MPDAHSELELKFAADHVVPKDFLRWCIEHNPSRYQAEAVPDIYYAQGPSVIRHRWLPGGAGELTVKQRKSRTSISNRVEIDLRFADGFTVNDVTAFLQHTGWKKEFTLFKDEVHMFWFDLSGGGQVNVSLYTVERLNERSGKCVDTKTFLEIEVEKGSKYTVNSSLAILDDWRVKVQKAFNLKDPMTLSLWEIYSGRRYQVVPKRFATK